MEIREMKIKDLMELKKILFSESVPTPRVEVDDIPFELGENYLIRTVTFTLTGKIKKITPKFLVLQDADWIADTGRFSEALSDQEKFNEIEPFKNDAIVGIGAIVDATKIIKLIRKMK